ncbi:TIGR03085 family metal-binding protein [Georgenia subflava]|uniref:TIGR03085 family protein n=1 Tax=Georgenia subflava TaxID=1622177 RepID=A0A6N7EGA4_9MICO|nr:TIGR03085 family metal-binding protein [Georgenia subflava]MPV35707.1 TIGR03085 family protein [Georgenia subflava]
MAWMELERQALAETLRDADPDAPTLCEGWTVRHLAAHLVQREHSPLHDAVDKLSHREPGSERYLTRLVEEARTEDGYLALVERFAAGLSPRSPMRWAGDRAHLLEYVIHHEDVRRAGSDPAEPRVLPTDLVRAIWEQVPTMARLGYRSSPVGVVFAVPGGPRKVVKKAHDAVVVVGDPVELALHSAGRRAAADVDVVGAPETLRRFEDDFPVTPAGSSAP